MVNPNSRMSHSSSSSTANTNTSPYPYPSNLNISNFVSLDLNSSNYVLWRAQMRNLIESQDLGGFISGETPAPLPLIPSPANSASPGMRFDQPNPDFTHWRRSDRLVRAWITSRLSEETLALVVDLETSREVWQALQDAYAHTSVEREFLLKQKLSLLSKEPTQSIHDYIRYFKSLCDDLSLIGKPLFNQDNVFHLLRGLGPDYNPFTTTMLRPPIPSYQSILPQLINYDTRTTELPKSLTPAFYANHNSKQTSKRHSQPSKPRPNRASFTSKGRGFTPHSSSLNAAKPTHHPTTSVRCQICKGGNHDALSCPHRFNHAYQPESISPALAALTLQDSDDANAWLPDTGAGAHMTNDAGILSNVRPYQGNTCIAVGNGDILDISHVGDTSIPLSSGATLPIKDVMVVPGIQKNLLSISQLTSSFPCICEFSDDGFVIKDKTTGMTLTKGLRMGDVYTLPRKISANFSMRFQTAAAHVWHARLGHPNIRLVHHLSNKGAIKISNKEPSSFICDHCTMAKASQLPFISVNKRSSFPFELIHIDLWGPSPVVSRSGFRYYACIVDDFTRFTWIILLKAKSEFFHHYLLFEKFVTRQFNTEIKTVQCDGGGEFINHQFLSHLASSGIRLQVSCPGTPQQNGVAERKHRHLRELGLTLIFASKVPLIYWPEAFQTSCFLINRLPSSVRGFSSPFYLLYKEHPDYSCLRTFGSRCFPLLKDSTSHKLAPKSLPCVFLGYSDRHKGYKCLYPATGKMFISRSVVFDETHFPYHDLSHLHHPSSDFSTTITHFSKTANLSPSSILRHPSKFDHTSDPLTPPDPPLNSSTHHPTPTISSVNSPSPTHQSIAPLSTSTSSPSSNSTTPEPPQHLPTLTP